MVGCPIYQRAWILPRWLDALAAQDSAELALAFVLTPGEDGTEKLIETEKLRPRFKYVDVYNFKGGKESVDRDWADTSRVATIAEKRNKVLEMAAHSECDYLLSLDSDVIVPPGGIAALLDTLKQEYDAVCPKVWIWDALFVAARYEKGKVAFLNRKTTGIQPVDIVTSGACLMKREVFENTAVLYGVSVLDTDFGFAPGSEVNGWHGSECIFWSKNAREAGYKLAANCNLSFKHIMAKEQLKS